MSTHPLCVLHIPHSSQEIPPDLRHTLLLDDDALEQELLRMTDRYTDLLFAQAPDDACAVTYPVSRLIVDPERFVPDSEEPMAACGMGVIYTHTSDGQPLRHPPSSGERDALLERFYNPHHCALTAAVSAALSEHDSALGSTATAFPPGRCPMNAIRPSIGRTSVSERIPSTPPCGCRGPHLACLSSAALRWPSTGPSLGLSYQVPITSTTHACTPS